MNDTIRVSDTSVTYQGVQPAYIVNKSNVSYCQIQGSFENDAIHLDYEILLKKSYVKKSKTDLIKNDTMVLQKRGNKFFILLSILDSDFSIGEDGKREASGSFKNSDYRYTYFFKEIEKEQVEKDAVEQNARKAFDDLLKGYGLNTEKNNPSDAIAATWKIGHPD